MKRLLLLVLGIVLTISSFTGCAWYNDLMQPHYEQRDRAYEYAEQFILAIANDNFETARTYLHPEIRDVEDIPENRIYELEEMYHFDFSDGVIIKTTIVGPIAIGTDDVEYNGGFKLIIGDENFDLYFVVIKNDSGFGISQITQYKPWHNQAMLIMVYTNGTMIRNNN